MRAGTLAAIAASLLVTAPAQASFPGRNGRLAWEFEEYDREGVQDHHIEVASLNGRVQAQLGSCKSLDSDPGVEGKCVYNPSFSRSGKRLAFDRDGRLAFAAPNGKRLVTLPELTEDDDDPAFSPDGKRLVFAGLEGGRRNLYTVRLDGRGLKQITSGGGRWPAWSSTGQIAYGDGKHVYRMRPGKPGRVRVAKGRHPDWSPSGRSIAYDHKRRIYRISVKKRAPRKRLSGNAVRPAYSPDGKRIAFQVDTSVYTSILTMDAGSGRRRKRVALGGELDVGSVFDYYMAPAWQPRP
jgi:dipeptidyl aminopeptidase/acylaminoacyl peptidase